MLPSIRVTENKLLANITDNKEEEKLEGVDDANITFVDTINTKCDPQKMLPPIPVPENEILVNKVESMEDEKLEGLDDAKITCVDNMNTECDFSKDTECVGEEFKNAADNIDDEKLDINSPFRLVLKAIPERASVAFNEVRSEFLGVAEIIAPSSPNKARAPVDIICVLDTSKSMKGSRMNLLKKTMNRFISAICEGDRLGIITFNRTASVALPLTEITKATRDNANKVIRNLRIRKGTNIEDGLRVGTTMVLERKGEVAKRVCSIIFFTDGEASKGKRTTEELLNTVHNAFRVPPSGDPEKWTPEDVRKWLAAVKLDIPKTLEKFKLMKIDGQILMQDLTEAMLEEELGVSSVHIAKFIRELEKLREGRADESRPSLQCSINCFGYGNKHNEDLLGQLSTNFDGLYYYVKNPSGISEGFATCLGGIISTCATNLQLSLTPHNGAGKVVMVSDFPVLRRGKIERQSASIRLGDIQEEEHRHVVFKFLLPAEKEATDTPPTYIAVKLSYTNAITGNIEATVASLDVERGVTTSCRSDKVDSEFNREEALRALTSAEAVAKSGRLGDARKILLKSSESIMTSSSNRNPLSMSLLKDLDTSVKGYGDHKSYSSWGKSYSSQNKHCLRSQRACNSSDRSFNTQRTYLTTSKRETAEIFRSTPVSQPTEIVRCKKKSTSEKEKTKKTPETYRLVSD